MHAGTGGGRSCAGAVGGLGGCVCAVLIGLHLQVILHQLQTLPLCFTTDQNLCDSSLSCHLHDFTWLVCQLRLKFWIRWCPQVGAGTA